jgi:hypothetical protein
MSRKKRYEEKLFLAIAFGEAIERFVRTDPGEIAVGIAKSKKAKPPGGKLRKPPDAVESQKVVRLASKRKPNTD